LQVQFTVSLNRNAWSLDRGQSHVSDYPSREHALEAAENFARAVTARGERAVVKVMTEGRVEESRSFAPDIF